MSSMRARPLKAAPSLMIAAMLSACGGGGGGGANLPASVSSKADILRSLAVVLNTASDFDPASNGLFPYADGSNAGNVAQANSDGSSSGSIPADCQNSGKQTEDASGENHTYTQFGGIVIQGDLYNDLFTDCQSDYSAGAASSGTITYNGVLVSGSGNYDVNAQDNTDNYSYVLMGKNGVAANRLVAQYDEQDGDGNVTSTRTYTLEGLIESGSFTDTTESRIRSLSVQKVDSTQSGTLSLVLGSDAALSLVRKSDGSLKINGPIKFQSTRSSSCHGDTLEVATTKDLQFGGSDGETLVDGTLNLSAGTTTVSVSFQSDGSALVSVGGAAAVPVSASELQAALAGPGC